MYWSEIIAIATHPKRVKDLRSCNRRKKIYIYTKIKTTSILMILHLLHPHETAFWNLNRKKNERVERGKKIRWRFVRRPNLFTFLASNFPMTERQHFNIFRVIFRQMPIPARNTKPNQIISCSVFNIFEIGFLSSSWHAKCIHVNNVHSFITKQ